jgi:hypothetical protein
MNDSFLVTAQKEFFVDTCGQLFFCYGTVRDWSDAVWREYLDKCVILREQRGPMRGMFIHQLRGGGPSAGQRRMIVEYDAKLGVSKFSRVVLVSESAMARAATTAIGWLMKAKGGANAYRVKGFAPGQELAALHWLQEEIEFDADQALAALNRLHGAALARPQQVQAM